MEHIAAALEALARDLAQLAVRADDPAISCRLDEMAGEVLSLAQREVADSRIYDSATFFRHTTGTNMTDDSGADDRSPCPAQRV